MTRKHVRCLRNVTISHDHHITVEKRITILVYDTVLASLRAGSEKRFQSIHICVRANVHSMYMFAEVKDGVSEE